MKLFSETRFNAVLLFNFLTDNRSKCDAEEKALALGIAKSKQPENSRKRRKGTFSLAGKKIKVFQNY